MDTAPAAVNDVCASLRPTVGFQHLLWSNTVSTQQDFDKCIVDPYAVLIPSAHFTSYFTKYSLLLENRRLAVPASIAVKIHDRVHEIGGSNATFAALMLPLLKAHLEAVLARNEDQHLPAFPSDTACASCGCTVGDASCTGQLTAANFSICRVYGGLLQQRVTNTLEAMRLAGAFHAWLVSNASVANLYGGHEVGSWAQSGFLLSSAYETADPNDILDAVALSLEDLKPDILE
jgi:hypothetical protein